MTRLTSIFATALLVFGLLAATAPKTEAGQAGRVDLQLAKAGFIVGLAGGTGTFYHKGKSYPLRVGGISFGPSITVSSYDVTGTVSNLKRPSDIYGNYTSRSAGFSIVGGGKVAVLTNVHGVRLELRARTIGVDLSLDLGGMNLRPR